MDQKISLRIEIVVNGLKKTKDARNNIIGWMQNNQNWYRELIAKEWERQTGESWEQIFKASLEAA